MFITEETISRVRDSNEIVEVISEFVPSLKRAGKDFKGLCPFHQEKTPSFIVSPSKGIFHCFGCGVGGDAFKFIMELERCSYPDAIRKLAEKKGIPVLEANASVEESEGFKKKKRLLEIVKRASHFYHKALLELEEAINAKNYLLKERGLTLFTIEKFQLGWAPNNGLSLLKVALKSGISELELEGAGLAKRYSESGKWTDQFKGRILFPILNSKGEAVGFGGRILEGALDFRGNPPPKYINSPETAVFQKGKNLYGYFQGLKELRMQNRAVIVEGYMDVIGCHQAGLCEAVAPLGTSLTEDQCRMLKRSVENVTLLFDSDRAGDSAALRGGDLLLEHGFLPWISHLPKGVDSDEYLQSHGVEEFRDLLKQGSTLFEFKCDWVKNSNGNLPSVLVKSMSAKAVLPLLLKVEDQVQRSEMVKIVARKLSLKEEAIMTELSKMGRSYKGDSLRTKIEEPLKIGTKNLVLSLDEELLVLAVQNEELCASLFAEFKAEDFSNDENAQKCFIQLKKMGNSGKLEELLAHLDIPASDWLRSALLRWKDSPDLGKIFKELMKRKKEKNKKTELEIIEKELVSAINQGVKIAEKDSARYQQLAKDLKG